MQSFLLTSILMALTSNGGGEHLMMPEEKEFAAKRQAYSEQVVYDVPHIHLLPIPQQPQPERHDFYLNMKVDQRFVK